MIKLFKKLFSKFSDKQRHEQNLLFSIFDNSVCSDHLLSFLPVNDLLRLRRVCKSSKTIVEDFIRTQKVKTVRQFTFTVAEEENVVEYSTNCQKGSNSLPIPSHVHFTKFTDKDQYFFSRAPMRNFIENCGSNITHLSFGYLQVRLSSQILLFQLFFEFFPNVTHLTVENIGPCDVNDEGSLSGGREFPFHMEILIPPSLKNIKTLRIRQSWHSENTFSFVIKLVEVCLPNLATLELPFEQFLKSELIKEQVVRWASMMLFNANNLRLEYVHGKFIEKLLRVDNRTPEMGTIDAMMNQINTKVVSVRNPQTTAFLRRIYNLEGIDFQNTSGCTFAGLKILKPEWPALKKISVCFGGQMWDAEVWEFLFGGRTREKNELAFEWKMQSEHDLLACGGKRRENVTMLDIKFEERLRLDDENDDEQMYRTFDIMDTCPNLKVLQFEWYCYERVISLSTLWHGLPLLEELRFNGCKALRDIDFMGCQGMLFHDGSPPFLKLKNLRVLEIVEMYHVSVTDRLLKEVICHMPLKKLCLSSKYNTHLITLEGIKSLLTGEFATTVEELCLKNLTLSGVTDEMKKSVEGQFRSSKMV